MRFTSRNINNFRSIKCVDYSDYKSETCRNGGDYAFGDTFFNNGDGSFTVYPYTSGEFCPKCGSWDCCGDCSENEIVSAVRALFIINHYYNNGAEITVE